MHTTHGAKRSGALHLAVSHHQNRSTTRRRGLGSMLNIPLWWHCENVFICALSITYHDQSDVDIAVAFETESSSKLTTRFAVDADLALALGTDNIDIVDLEAAPRSLVRAVFRDVDRLIGRETEARRIRTAVRDRKKTTCGRLQNASATHSPRLRITLHDTVRRGGRMNRTGSRND